MSLSLAPHALNRLRELRQMFGIGQRAASLVEELFNFLGEVIPLMEEIDASLRATTGQMPDATRQLRDVTQATELATTEILDLVDAVLLKLDALEAPDAERAAADGAAARLGALLRERLPDADAALWAEVEPLLAAAAPVAAPPTDAFAEVRADLNQILISLQVQDITAQQIAAVNHLIEQVRSGLDRLIRRLAHEEGEPAPPAGPEPETFNPAARYDRSADRQALVDRLTAGAPPEAVPEPAAPAASQEDIDALFGAASAADAPAARAAAADAGPTSQADIDALFGG
ncbi:MAG: protein phosphatase CheZ [Rhodothermales bacterium]|nr:protein phosphatase CheZ [Rhodothermales bacterium]